MPTHIALATCADLPDGDEDALLLMAALDEQGIKASWQVWTDPTVDWARFDTVVVRSTWDYTRRRDEFLDWAANVGAQVSLANPGDVLRWSSDKIYLRDLAALDVPIVPTAFFAPGEAVTFPSGEFVVKPSVGAGSRGAGRFGPDRPDAAREHAAMLHEAGLTVLVQPNLAEVDTAGETALVYFGGEFSHAVRKAPMLAAIAAYDLAQDDLFVPERITPRNPSAAELALGSDVLAAAGRVHSRELLYARVDLLPSADGPVLIELELCEPSLFLSYDEKAATRLARALATRPR
jgi:glutathione synthase/RimK-type ligase-like ATP-grasp enzyme